MTSKRLTARQQAIYLFIRGRMARYGYPPSVREIGVAFKIASPNGVTCHMKALERKGVIERDPKKARGIRLVEPISPTSLPVLGRINAGVPVLAEENIEFVDFGDLFAPGNFILTVRGESLFDAQIAPGDLAFIRAQPDCEDGEIAAVSMPDGELMLERVYHTDGGLLLVPDNALMQDRFVAGAEVHGVLVSIIRKFN